MYLWEVSVVDMCVLSEVGLYGFSVVLSSFVELAYKGLVEYSFVGFFLLEI